MLRELAEELAAQSSDLQHLVCVGLARDREIVQPELLFESRVDLSFEELQARWQHAAARAEHAELVWVADEPDAIVPFLASCGPIAPVAAAGLYLHGQRQWGHDWCRASWGA